jgi:DNA repair exonuclease SbcCD ATPase subunit
MEEEGEVLVERSAEEEKSLASRLFRFLIRLFFVVLLGAAIGIGAYYGVPALYRNFIEPIQTNSSKIVALEEALESDAVEIREKFSGFSSDISQIEGTLAEQREDLATLQSQAEGLGSKIEDLHSELDAVQSIFEQLQTTEDKLEALDGRLGNLEAAFEEEEEPPIDNLQKQIQLLRVMELVTRSRYWMIQNNLGMVTEDLLDAKEILESLDVKTMDEELLESLIQRIDQVLFEIPLSPIIAGDDLEIVWQLLLLATAP